VAKIGLAAELAKQAAQAAREEMAAAHAEDVAPARGAKPKPWTVPVLAHGFTLDTALESAAMKVTSHYRTVLAPQGLMVDLEQAAPATDSETADVAPVRQAEPQLQASLREQQSGRLVKAYTAPALLALFAVQQQATGVVVDGQV
jgi:hypothetical protein